MQQANSHVRKVKIFFSKLSGIATFFSRSREKQAFLTRLLSEGSRASATKWNFNSRIVNTVYENLGDLVKCFETIRTSASFHEPTVREASGYVRMLQDEDFNFFLCLFHEIKPHVDILYLQLQKKDIDAVFISQALQSFTSCVQAIR